MSDSIQNFLCVCGGGRGGGGGEAILYHIADYHMLFGMRDH